MSTRIMTLSLLVRGCALAGLFVFAAPSVEAVIVDSASIINLNATDIFAFPEPAPSGSGLGTLDLRLLQHGSGGANNVGGGFNFDNANTGMAAGAIASTNESYITSVGELRDFYELNFPDGSGGSTVNELLLLVNINETGGPPNFIALNDLDLIVDFTVPALDPATGDITTAQQNAINVTYQTGSGTRLVRLESAINLGQVNTGIGQPDRFIRTGFNPFAPSFGTTPLADSTEILFHWRSSAHDNGGEVVYLSGTFSPEDLQVIPEPASAFFIGTGLLCLLGPGTLRRARIML